MIWAVTRYELLRLKRKRITLLLAVLAFSPLIMALIARAINVTAELAGCLWIILFGVSVHPAFYASPGPGGFAWIIGVLIGGDLLASEMEDGSAAYLLSKPVSRREVVAGKLLGLSIVLAAYYAVVMVSAIIASVMLGDHPAWLSVAPVLYITTLASTIGFALLSCSIGAVAGKGSRGVTGAFVLCILLTIVVAVVSWVLAPRVTWTTSIQNRMMFAMKVSTVIPFTNLCMMPALTLLSHWSLPISWLTQALGELVEMTPWCITSALITIVVLALMACRVYSRKDF